MTEISLCSVDICKDCSHPCCEFLPKPRYCKIETNCEFYIDKKCSKYLSDDWRARIEVGRPIVCELFPAVVDLPQSEGKFIKMDILMHSFCKYGARILELPSEREKIGEIIAYVFEKAAKNEHIDMTWGQFQIIRREILKNTSYKLRIEFTKREVS